MTSPYNSFLGIQGVRIITESGSVTMLKTDTIVEIAQTTAAACSVAAPPTSSPIGKIFTVKDNNGVAGTYNITITFPDSTLADGSSTYVINTNYGSVSFWFDGAEWNLQSSIGGSVTGRALPYRIVTASGTVTMTALDGIVEVKKTVAAATAVTAPAATYPGLIYYVADGKGDAASNNITITFADTTTYLLDSNYGMVGFTYNSSGVARIVCTNF